jgi:TP901 family phage tail tape measure protein
MSAPNATDPNVVLTANVAQYQASMGQAQTSTDGLIDKLNSLNKAMDNVFKSAGRKLEIFGAGSMAAIGGAVTALAQVDAQLRQVRAQVALVGNGATDVNKLSQNVRTLSANLGQPQQQITALMTTISALGVQGTANIEKLTKTFTQLQMITGESGPGLANSLIGLTRSMGNSLDPNQINQYASSVANLSAKMGTSATGITQFAQAIQPLGKLLGLNETQLLGVSGAFSKAGADSQAAANAFGQIATLLTNDVQTGNPQIKQFADLLGVSTDAMTKLVKTNPAEAMNGLFESLNKRGPQALQFLQSIGLDGVRSLNAIQRVSQGGGLAEGLGIAASAKPGDLTKGTAASMNDLDAQLTKVGHTIQDLVTGPFAALEKVFTAVVKGVNFVLQGFEKFANMPGIHQLMEAMGVLAAAAAPVIALGGALLTLVPVLAHLGILWTLIFSKTGVSMVSGIRDGMRGVRAEAQGTTATMSAAQRSMMIPRDQPGSPGLIRRGIYGGGAFMGRQAGRYLPEQEPGAAAGFFRRTLGLAGRGAMGAANMMYFNPAGQLIRGVGAMATGGIGGAAEQALNRPSTTPGLPFLNAAGRRVFPMGGATPGATAAGDSARAAQAAMGAEMTRTQKIMGSFGVSMSNAAKNVGAQFSALGKKLVGVSDAAVGASTRQTGANDAEAAAANEASASLRVLAGRAATAGAAMGASAIGGLARGGMRAGAGLMGALGGPWGMAITGALIGGPMLYSAYQNRNKQIGTDDMEKMAGSTVGSLNSFNAATGGATTSLKSMTDAATAAAKKISQGGLATNAPAFGKAEIAASTDAAFKAAGYDPKSKSTTTEQIAQLQSTILTQISRPGGGPLTATQQQNLRQQLEHLLPDNIPEAKKYYQSLSDATNKFTQAPQALTVAYQTFNTLGKDYIDNIKRAAGTALTFNDAWESKGSQRARDRSTTPLGVLNLQSAASSGAARTQISNVLRAEILGAAVAVQGGSVTGSGPTVNVPQYGQVRTRAPATTPVNVPGYGTVRGRALPPDQPSSILGGGGAGIGGTGAWFKALATKLGLPAEYGNVTNLQDFVAKMFASKDKNVVNEATRIFGKKGEIDYSDPQKALKQMQDSQDANRAAMAAQEKNIRQYAFKAFDLQSIGIKAGSQGAKDIGDVLGGSKSQDPITYSRAVDAAADSLTKAGMSATDSTAAFSKWSAGLDQSQPATKQLTADVLDLTNKINDMKQSTMSAPQLLGSLRQQKAAIDPNDPNAPQERARIRDQQIQAQQGVYSQAQQYLLAMHSFNIQRQRSAEDYNLQVSRSTEQFNLQMERANFDYHKQVERSDTQFHLQQSRSETAFQLQMKQSTEDYNKSRARATRDFIYQEQQYVKGVAQSLDPYSQMQAQSVNDASMVLQNMSTQNQAYKDAGKQLDALRKMGLSQNAIDVLGLSDPKNIQQLARTYSDLAANPTLIKSYNDSIKGRLKWTKGLATDQSSTEWRNMKHQFDTAANDAKTDFDNAMSRAEKAFKLQEKNAQTDFQTITQQNADDFKEQTQNSEHDFNVQMTNMRTDYETSLKRSLHDVNDFATEAYGTANQIMARALATSKGNLHAFFQAAEDEFHSVNITYSGSGSGGGGAGGANPFTGNKGKVYAGLAAAGFSETAIAGLMGNIVHESNFNPTASDGTAYGIVQWQGNRLAALQRYANAHHKPISDLQTQINFMVAELKGGGYVSAGQLNAEPSAALAANLINAKYEVSGDKTNKRPASATAYYAQIHAANASNSHKPVSASLHRGRTDQGVDWTGAGSVYAVGPGKIVNLHNSGWPGAGAFITLKLDHPLSGGRGYVYYAEDIRPSVRIGQHVAGGATIGKATGGSTGIEIGWAAPPGTTGETLAASRGHQAPGADPGERPSPEGKDFAKVYLAEGGVVHGGRTAHLGERGPEAVLPLNQRGVDFILHLAQQMNHAAGSARMGRQYASPVAQTINHTHVDSSTNFTGEITVQAQDPNAMAVALQNKARLRALTNPGLATASQAGV